MNAQTIDDMVKAVSQQCGLFASVKRHHHPEGNTTTTVQISLDKEVKCEGEWAFFDASNDKQLAYIRNELAAFIAKNRRDVA